jgi:hypothetical protein
LLEDIRRDPTASFLLRNSSLTEAQLDTILASNAGGNLDLKRGLREKGRVSKGAFARTLKQAQHNVESSVFTLFLLAYLDLVPSENFAQFARTARMLGQLKDAEPTREEAEKVIEAMQEFAKRFSSQKRKLIL